LYLYIYWYKKWKGKQELEESLILLILLIILIIIHSIFIKLSFFVSSSKCIYKLIFCILQLTRLDHWVTPITCGRHINQNFCLVARFSRPALRTVLSNKKYFSYFRRKEPKQLSLRVSLLSSLLKLFKTVKKNVYPLRVSFKPASAENNVIPNVKGTN
jgi:hypothetical protein